VVVQVRQALQVVAQVVQQMQLAVPLQFLTQAHLLLVQQL
jgi:hypothetical protein